MASVTTVTKPLSNTLQGLENPPPEIITQQTTGISSLETRCHISLGGFPSELIKLMFMHYLTDGDIKSFKALSVTNRHFNATMRTLVNTVALTTLCPNLRILDARALKFQADLTTVHRYNTLLSYFKLEPFVEGRAGFTVLFNKGGLTLKDMQKNKYGTPVNGPLELLEKEDSAIEMISNAPVTETRNQPFDIQEKRVCDVGFDGKPTPVEYLALMIASNKELGICLYGPKPFTYGATSKHMEEQHVVVAVGQPSPGHFHIATTDSSSGYRGAGGRLKLQTLDPKFEILKTSESEDPAPLNR